MNLIKLTKSKANNLLSMLSRATSISDNILLINDIIVPIHYEDNIVVMGSETENGTHYIHNTFIELPQMNIPFVVNFEKFTLCKEHLKLTGIGSIELLITDIGMTIIIDTIEYQILYPIRNTLAFDYTINYTQLVDSINNKSQIVHYNHDTLPIVNGSVVSLESVDGNLGKVRISRTNFPLIGSVRKDDSDAVKFSYTTLITNAGPTIVLMVNYKKIEAIHMYGYVIYE